MAPSIEQDSFMVWASDHMVYGPVDLPTLTQWVTEERVFPKTWLLSRNQNHWAQAEKIEALGPFFVNNSIASLVRSGSKRVDDMVVEELRQFSAFTGLSNDQLEQFAQFGELVEAPPKRVILRHKDPSDSLFFLLSGELRVRLVVGAQDKTLGRVNAGECFGEIAMFMRAPRTADVVVESQARMLRVTSEAFLLLINQLPQIAAPILFGMARVMATRVSERNQQYQREVTSEFLWR
jgi:CRP-like cAMP-binding protein